VFFIYRSNSFVIIISNTCLQPICYPSQEIDIKKAPPLDRSFLIIHGGKDIVVPSPKDQVDYFMDWAVGEKELKWYPLGEHCCANYFDEVIPYSIDWFRKKLLN